MDPRTVEETILDLERAALDQWSSGNPVGYARSAAEDVTYLDDIGAQSRLDGLQKATAYLSTLQEQLPEHRYEIVEPKVQVYGGVAILSFRYQPSSLEGESLTPWKATTVYRETEAGWCMVHANWSMIKSP